METRIEQTIERRNKGYNCAQAVACTYCDLFGIDENTMLRITEAFGVGMGNMEGTCGAISGACVILGLLNSSGDSENVSSKGATGKLARQVMEQFKARNSSVICKELKGVTTGKMLRSCPDCIRDAAEFLENILQTKEGEK